jgi:hypothetical protein
MTTEPPKWDATREEWHEVDVPDAPPAPLWLKAFLAIVACALAYWFLTWVRV